MSARLLRFPAPRPAARLELQPRLGLRRRLGFALMRLEVWLRVRRWQRRARRRRA